MEREREREWKPLGHPLLWVYLQFPFWTKQRKIPIFLLPISHHFSFCPFFNLIKKTHKKKTTKEFYIVLEKSFHHFWISLPLCISKPKIKKKIYIYIYIYLFSQLSYFIALKIFWFWKADKICSEAIVKITTQAKLQKQLAHRVLSSRWNILKQLVSFMDQMIQIYTNSYKFWQGKRLLC